MRYFGADNDYPASDNSLATYQGELLSGMSRDRLISIIGELVAADQAKTAQHHRDMQVLSGGIA